MKKWIVSVGMIICLFHGVQADEGMWLPHLIGQNFEEMQAMGLKLNPSQIYDVNHSSLKDAIVSFGGFCTGEIISPKGLILTNHHCGFGQIQQLSTVENNLVDNGFWARTHAEELPNKGLFVQFLVRIEDVTVKVLKDVKPGMTEYAREAAVARNISQLQRETKGDTHYDVVIKPVYEGSEYLLFVYERYNDVRLVGAPPESIGKFGGDTDNWMWPRHTGDFALFRVYAGPDGKPADYSPENVPLKPKHHLPVSLRGVEQGSFAMVMGFPGSTERFLTSGGVALAMEQTLPTRIKIRAKKLDIMKEDMDASKAVQLKYVSKYYRVSNYYKYFMGQMRGIENLDVYDKKLAREAELSKWISARSKRQKVYGDVLGDLDAAYRQLAQYELPYHYFYEAGFGIEFVRFGYKYKSLIDLLENDSTSTTALEAELAAFSKAADEFYKDYNAPTDKKIFMAMSKMLYDEVDEAFHPDVFNAVKLTDADKSGDLSGLEIASPGDFFPLAQRIFEQSILVDESKMSSFLAQPDADLLKSDPGYIFANSIYNAYRALSIKRGNALKDLNDARRRYIAGLREMLPDELFYPDANFTMRVTYGDVQGYSPQDAVWYHYATTLQGVMQKEDPNNPEFTVPDKLEELYKQKDFGQYGLNGTMPVGFISNNDITGGNSGSPVINGNGELIGLAFDGNWEAMSGDIVFEKELQRCISVDIRYVLFIIDKFAGASHLIEEMTLVGMEDSTNRPKKDS